MTKQIQFLGMLNSYINFDFFDHSTLKVEFVFCLRRTFSDTTMWHITVLLSTKTNIICQTQMLVPI